MNNFKKVYCYVLPIDAYKSDNDHSIKRTIGAVTFDCNEFYRFGTLPLPCTGKAKYLWYYWDFSWNVYGSKSEMIKFKQKIKKAYSENPSEYKVYWNELKYAKLKPFWIPIDYNSEYYKKSKKEYKQNFPSLAWR